MQTLTGEIYKFISSLTGEQLTIIFYFGVALFIFNGGVVFGEFMTRRQLRTTPETILANKYDISELQARDMIIKRAKEIQS